MESFCVEHDNFVRLHVFIAPRASRNAVVGEYQQRLKIALAAPPVDGEANKALIEYVSALLGLSKREISIEKGMTSKRKTLLIRSLTAKEVLHRLLGSK